jgi:predicted aminopeptidase
MGKPRSFRIQFWLGLLLLAVALSGCQSLSYYRQAVQGQCQIWSRERPIAKLIADPQTPAPLKAKLQWLVELRTCAKQELKLPVDGHYQKYADLGRRYVVWNVNAAPELSLQPKRWWYPFVGRLKYRGYFSEPYARAYGAKLARDHYDVYVGGVEAYSTLGWFHDPVLNTWINHDTADVAEILFHELAHQRVFAHGDTDFNEAFATTVAQEGVRRWLLSRGNTNDYQGYLADLQHNEQFVRLVMETRAQLEAVYGEHDPEEDSAGAPPKLNLSDAQKRQAKTRIVAGMAEQYKRLKAQWGGDTTFDRWFTKPVNNARLNTVSAYYRWVPAFEALLDKNGGNLERFYQAAAKLAELSKAERKHTLEALLPKTRAAQSLAARRE